MIDVSTPSSAQLDWQLESVANGISAHRRSFGKVRGVDPAPAADHGAVLPATAAPRFGSDTKSIGCAPVPSTGLP